MGVVAGLVALGVTLLAGLVFIAGGGAMAAAILQRLPRRGTSAPPFKQLWRVAALAFFAGLLLGNGLTWLWGGPSPVTTLIALPLYLALFALLLRRRFPEEFASRSWGHTLLQVLFATLGSCAAIVGAITGLRLLVG